jgi:hypothetical protein
MDGQKCRVTEYRLMIKTQPHTGWTSPGGWGPYYTERDADRARVQADKLWMAAKIVESVSDATLTSEQIRDLRALGQPVAVLSSKGVV